QSLRTTIGRWFGRGDGPVSHGQLIMWLLRGCFGAVVIGLAMLGFRQFNEESTPFYGYLAFFIILGCGLLIVITDLLIRNKQITYLSALYFGLLLGLLLGNIFSSALEPFLFDWDVGNPQQAQYKTGDLTFNPKTGEFHLQKVPQPSTVVRAQGQKKALVTL